MNKIIFKVGDIRSLPNGLSLIGFGYPYQGDDDPINRNTFVAATIIVITGVGEITIEPVEIQVSYSLIGAKNLFLVVPPEYTHGIKEGDEIRLQPKPVSMEQVKKLIEEIRTMRAEYNLGMPGPVVKDTLYPFIIEFKKRFNEWPPLGYLELLKTCDGLSENGATIYASFDHEEDGVLYGIFEMNEIWYEQDEHFKQYIHFGTGNMDLYVYDKKEKNYQVLDRYSGDTFETFSTFEQLAEYILKLMLD